MLTIYTESHRKGGFSVLLLCDLQLAEDYYFDLSVKESWFEAVSFPATSDTASVSVNSFLFFVNVGATPNIPIPLTASSIKRINALTLNVLLRYFIYIFFNAGAYCEHMQYTPQHVIRLIIPSQRSRNRSGG